MPEIKKHHEKYHYSIEMEEALLELCGPKSKWNNMSGAFQNVSVFREAIMKATLKIRSRLEQIITNDDRLLLTTSITLDRIDREARKLKKDSNNEIDIIANLINLIAHLIGYDWLRGEPNRHVIYYQTLEQQSFDDSMRHPKDISGKFEFEKRIEIILSLYGQNIRVAQIAKIMGLSETMVKNTLVYAGKIERKTQTKMT